MYQTLMIICILLWPLTGLWFAISLIRAIFKKSRRSGVRQAKVSAVGFVLTFILAVVFGHYIYKDYGLTSKEGLEEAKAARKVENDAAAAKAAEATRVKAEADAKTKAAADAQSAKDQAKKDAADKAAALAMKCNDKIAAFVMSQEFVKRNLKAPSTAAFPWFTDDQVSVVAKPGCSFTVLAWVDSQNSFGAQLRSRYVVNLKYVDVGDSWHMTDIAIK